MQQLSARSAHVKRAELIGVETALTLDLGNDLIAPSLDAESIHEITPKHGAQIRPNLLEIKSQRGNLVAVKGDLGLGLIVFEVTVGEHEDAAGKGRSHQIIRRLKKLPGLDGRRNDEFDRKITPAG